MPQLTYYSRLQGLLSEFAKQGRMRIVLQDIIYKICGQFTGSGMHYGPRYRDHIMSAVKREVRARRVVRDTIPDLECLVFTASGERFYKEWGLFPIYGRGDPRIRSLTVRKLSEHTRILSNMVDELQDVFYEFNFGDQNIGAVAVPDTVKSLCKTVDVLQVQNTDLQRELNYLRGDRRRLRARLLSQMARDLEDADGRAAEIGIDDHSSDDDMEIVI